MSGWKGVHLELLKIPAKKKTLNQGNNYNFFT